MALMYLKQGALGLLACHRHLWKASPSLKERVEHERQILIHCWGQVIEYIWFLHPKLECTHKKKSKRKCNCLYCNTIYCLIVTFIAIIFIEKMFSFKLKYFGSLTKNLTNIYNIIQWKKLYSEFYIINL